MTYKEAERVFIAGAPVECENNRVRVAYKEISGLIFRRDAKSGGYTVSLELADKCGYSFTTVRPGAVSLSPGWEGSLPEELPPAYEDGPSAMELNAKLALRSGCPVIFEGERWRVTAVKVCNWVKLEYWLHLELTRISDGLVTMAWAGSIAPEDTAG